MNSRKRHAPEPLPPSRAAKLPRTSHSSQPDSLRSLWLGLGNSFVQVAAETVRRIVPTTSASRFHPDKMQFGPTFITRSVASSAPDDASSSQLQLLPSDTSATDDETEVATERASSQAPDSPCTPTPAAPVRMDRVPLPSPPPSDSSIPSSLSKTHSLLENTQSTEPDNTPGSSITTSWSTQPSPLLAREPTSENLVPKFKGLKIAQTLSEVDFKWPVNYTPHPQVDEALARTPVQPSKPRRQKPIKNREHIFSKVHKAKVVEERQKNRTELLKCLLEAKRKQGYTGSLVELEGWVSYARKLEGIGGLQPALSPSTEPSEDHDFLKRALHRAQRTLKAPVAKPFTPSLDELRTKLRGKDREIDNKLRPPRPTLPENLPSQDESRVAALLKQRGVVSKFDREQVTDQDISRLRPGQWLNDEIINFYGAMILARSDASKENPGAAVKSTGRRQSLNIHYFSTFFWTKLTKDGYEKGRLAKWTKKIDIFSKDAILIPVNHNNAHWTAASINFKDKRIESFDSMGMAKEVVFKHLRAYVDAEHRNKKKKPFDFTGWENYAPDDITPQQENGYDCGVFTCQFLEHLSRGEEEFVFTQKDMPYLRRRMIWEIGNAKLRDDY